MRWQATTLQWLMVYIGMRQAFLCLPCGGCPSACGYPSRRSMTCGDSRAACCDLMMACGDPRVPCGGRRSRGGRAAVQRAAHPPTPPAPSHTNPTSRASPPLTAMTDFAQAGGLAILFSLGWELVPPGGPRRAGLGQLHAHLGLRLHGEARGPAQVPAADEVRRGVDVGGRGRNREARDEVRSCLRAVAPGGCLRNSGSLEVKHSIASAALLLRPRSWVYRNLRRSRLLGCRSGLDAQLQYLSCPQGEVVRARMLAWSGVGWH